MCIPGCGGTGKSQLIRALSKYFAITKRMQMLRKLAPTGIAAAETGGITIHSFLGEQRNSRQPRIGMHQNQFIFALGEQRNSRQYQVLVGFGENGHFIVVTKTHQNLVLCLGSDGPV